MNIGILTLPFNNNYGGLLQAYALQEYLRNQGHNVWIIKHRQVPENRTIIRRLKDVVREVLFLNYKKKKFSKNMRLFENNYLRMTSEIKLKKRYNCLKSKYKLDAIVVGSDQVWRKDYTKEDYLDYFLDFATNWNVKKIAFSASFGIDKWTFNSNETKKISYLLKKFDFVSVREVDAIDLCKNHLHVDACNFLDPTLLHSAKFYNQIANNNKLDGGVSYILDEDILKNDIILQIQEKLNIKITPVGQKNGVYDSVQDWLGAFANADFIVTDSFHGVVFSIIYRKNFVAIINKERGAARFNSLIETFGLEEQFITSVKELNQISWKIDYSNIDSLLKMHVNEMNRLIDEFIF